MSSTPSRIELTCEFIPSILSGSIGFVTFVWCRHLDGPGWLVHITPRPDPLTGAEDLPGARQVEGMHITVVTVQRTVLPAPAASAPTSRPPQTAAGGTPFPGLLEPWHTIGVE